MLAWQPLALQLPPVAPATIFMSLGHLLARTSSGSFTAVVV